MTENEEVIEKTSINVIEEGENIGIMVNEGKSKCMVITIRKHHKRKLEVHNYNFERVSNFNYLEVDVNENADSLIEIKLRLVAANKCYFGLISLFNSKILSWRTKILLYKVLARLIVLYVCCCMGNLT